MAPLFSIVVPIYKVEAYLPACVDSLLAQTECDFECLLVDDGSPDRSGALCDEYAKTDARFKVIHKENGGLSDARNSGILAATGQYVVFLDGDDYLAAPSALADLKAVIDRTSAAVVCNTGLTEIHPDGATTFSDYFKECGEDISTDAFYEKWRHLPPGGWLAGWFFVVERLFLIKHGLLFKKGIVHEDEHWMPRLLCSTSSLAINHHAFYAYRQSRAGSIMADLSPKRVQDTLFVIQDLIERGREAEPETVCRRVCYWRAAYLWLGLYVALAPVEANDAQYAGIQHALNSIRGILIHGRITPFIIFLLVFGIKPTRRLQQMKQRLSGG